MRFGPMGQYLGTFGSTVADQASRIASAHGLHVFETLLPQPDSYIHRADAVMAHDDDVIVRVELLMGAGRNVSHGN